MITQSAVFTPAPIVAAVAAADKFLGPDRVWRPTNKEQELFLAKFWNRSLCDLDIIKAIATETREQLLAWLEENGWPGFQIDPFLPNSFGIGGIFDQLVDWYVPGTRLDQYIRSQNTGDKMYDAVKLKQAVRILDMSCHPHPVASAMCKDGRSQVFFTYPNYGCLEHPFDMFFLAQTITQLELKGSSTHQDHEGIIIPMLDLATDVNVDWIKDMETDSERAGEPPWYISQAKMKARLRLNEFGARAEAAFAGAVTMRGLAPQPFVFDRPFLIWFTLDNVVTFVAYVTEESWSDPGSLSE